MNDKKRDTSPKNDRKRKKRNCLYSKEKKLVFSSLEEYERWRKGLEEAIGYLEEELGGIH